MAQSFTSLHYHIVFSTKERRHLITPTLKPHLYGVIGGIIATDGGTLLRIGGTADHVHISATLSKNITVPDQLRNIKAVSSKWVHEHYPTEHAFAWQNGYGAFTISYKGLPRVAAYIEDQMRHHQQETFKEEFVRFLEEHGVEYDLQYVFD
jgi:REP element-mobilizing transposase RayT